VERVPARVCHCCQSGEHRSYPALSEDHIRRETGRTFAVTDGDPDIKLQQLLGDEEMVRALRQAFELQALFCAARPWKMSTRKICESQSLVLSEKTTDNLHTGAVCCLAIFEKLPYETEEEDGWR
jgi:hypothetical protein